MKGIDPKGLESYNAGVEYGRLHHGLGLIEFARTKELLLERLPPPPAVVYDIGGAYGEYAFWLAERGYQVSLFDLSEAHIRMATEHQKESGVMLERIMLADAREIPVADGFADAILLFGPLYHLTEADDRAACLSECKRLLRPGGMLFTANITRFSTTLNETVFYDQLLTLDDAEHCERLMETVRTGIHRGKKVGTMYFHRPDELRQEIASAGFRDVTLHGVIGPCWMLRNLDEVWQNPHMRDAIMRIVRLLDGEESLMGLSTHFVSISHK